MTVVSAATPEQFRVPILAVVIVSVIILAVVAVKVLVEIAAAVTGPVMVVVPRSVVPPTYNDPPNIDTAPPQVIELADNAPASVLLACNV